MAFSIGYAAPGQVTQNLDTVLTLAFANSGNTIFDAISKNNAVFYEIKKNGMYESVESPEPYVEVPLMYGLGQMEWYEGWDVLGTQPTEGITAAVYPWRQAACPAGYNRREQRTTNPNRIKEISKVKIQQAQMTMTEGFNRAFLQGNLANGGLLTDNFVSASTSRSGIEPLATLIYYKSGVQNLNQPSDALSVGGLDQSKYSWWRNWSLDLGAITKTSELLFNFDLMMSRCSRGPGGAPKVILTDETTRALLNQAYFERYRTNLTKDADYPFDNLMFRGARVVTDELIPDIHNSGTDATAVGAKGSAWFVHTDFLKIKYDSQCNFILTDLQKPVNQDGKVGHVLWMGNCCMMNRRKHGVVGNIPRTLTIG